MNPQLPVCTEPVFTSGVLMVSIFCGSVVFLLTLVILAVNAPDIAKAWRTWRKDD